MTEVEEVKLRELARTVKNLRWRIDAINLMINVWTQHRYWVKEAYFSLSDDPDAPRHIGVCLPAEVVQADLIPALERIRDESARKIRELAPEIKS